MCGIFAYLNYSSPKSRQYILETLVNGLKRLEYRGYDSAGVAFDRDFFDDGEDYGDIDDDNSHTLVW